MRKLWIVVLALPCLAAVGWWLDPTGVLQGWLRSESFWSGRPASYWSQSLRSEDPLEQSEARQQLEHGGADAVAVLTEVLADRGAADWQATEARWNAAEILGRIGPAAQSASPALLEALQDPDLHVRSVAAGSLPLVDTPAEQAVPALLDLLRRDASESAIRALSKYGPDARPALDDLVRLLSDKSLDTELRWNAARALGKMQESGAEAIPVLVLCLQDTAQPCVSTVPKRSAISALSRTARHRPSWPYWTIRQLACVAMLFAPWARLGLRPPTCFRPLSPC